jgi:hypothetical protein
MIQRIVTRLAAMILLALTSCAPAAGAAPLIETAKPNILFILLDDADARTFSVMPLTRELIAERGMAFENFLLNVSLCCPARRRPHAWTRIMSYTAPAAIPNCARRSPSGRRVVACASRNWPRCARKLAENSSWFHFTFAPSDRLYIV